MPKLYKFYGVDPSDSAWISDIGTRTVNECRKLLLFISGIDSIYPFNLQLFGYHRYSPNKRIVRVTTKYIIRYVISGRGHFNGMPISRGDCYVSVPGQKYEIESDPEEPLVHYWVELHSGKAPLYVERMFGSIEPGVYPISFIDRCETIFHELLFEPHPQEDIPTYGYSTFFRLLALHTKHTPNAAPRSNAMTIYLNAVDYIESHYQRRIRVSDLCEYLHIVPDYLYKIFKQHSGLSTQEYIAQSKMKMASLLLETTDESIADIANMVGYSEAGRFSKAFRDLYGITPTKHRETKKKEK